MTIGNTTVQKVGSVARNTAGSYLKKPISQANIWDFSRMLEDAASLSSEMGMSLADRDIQKAITPNYLQQICGRFFKKDGELSKSGAKKMMAYAESMKCGQNATIENILNMFRRPTSVYKFETPSAMEKEIANGCSDFSEVIPHEEVINRRYRIQ